MPIRRWCDLYARSRARVRAELPEWDEREFRTALSRAKLEIESHGVPVEYVVLGTELFARLLRYEAQREGAGLAPEFFDATCRWLWGMRVILDPTRTSLTCVLLPADPVLILDGRHREV